MFLPPRSSQSFFKEILRLRGIIHIYGQWKKELVSKSEDRDEILPCLVFWLPDNMQTALWLGLHFLLYKEVGLSHRVVTRLRWNSTWEERYGHPYRWLLCYPCLDIIGKGGLITLKLSDLVFEKL